MTPTISHYQANSQTNNDLITNENLDNDWYGRRVEEKFWEDIIKKTH